MNFLMTFRIKSVNFQSKIRYFNNKYKKLLYLGRAEELLSGILKLWQTTGKSGEVRR